MKFFEWIKGVVSRMFKSDAKKIFNTDILLSDKMEKSIKLWNDIASGEPPWLSKEDDVRTINFAKFICSDIAKKTCLDIDINVTGSARADYIQSVMEKLKGVIRDKVEDAAITGGIMFKPNGSSNPEDCIDYVLTDNFLVTHRNANGDILGAIFIDRITKKDKYYRRMEWHRFEGDVYVISNKAFESTQRTSLGREISLKYVPEWQDINPEIGIENLEKPLFAYFKLPYNNIIDNHSALGVSAFSNAIEELKDLDVAWSRKSGEIEDSKHITFVSATTQKYAEIQRMSLPRFVKSLELGTEGENIIHDRDVKILTAERIAEINSTLSMISTKVGFSQGAFVLDRKTGAITATQVESDDQETIQTIKDIRDALKAAVENLIYAIDKYCDLYGTTPLGAYKAEFAFGDLTYNWEEDRARHYMYVQAGYYPLWRYYMKFEGMSEEEAKAVALEAKKEQSNALFEEEE